jgi:ATP-binding cassette, subfamily B, bacterial
MTNPGISSKARYHAYLQKRKTQGFDTPADDASPAEVAKAKPKSRPFKRLLREYWRLIASDPRRIRQLALCLATVGLASLITLAMPLSTKLAIDHVITNTPGPVAMPAWVPIPDDWRTNELADALRVRMLWIIGSALVGLAAIKVVIGTWGRWQLTRMTKTLQVAMQRRVFRHAVRLPLHRVQQIKSGGVASMLREDAGGTASLLFHLFYNPFQAILQLVGILIVLAIVDWRMLLGGLLLLPVVWITHKTWIGRIRPLFRDIRHTRTQIDGHTAEAFAGTRIVRGFARESGEAARFARGTHYMTRQEILTWWWSRGVDIAWSLFIPIASTGVLVYCGWGVIKGQLTVGDVMMFLTYLTMLLGPLEAIASSATEMQTNLAALDRVLDLLEEPREFADQRGARPIDPTAVRGRITLEYVAFSYPPRKGERETANSTAHASSNSTTKETGAPAPDPASPRAPVLAEVTLDVPAGTTVALVGPSGAGKTTLCNLVARFYDPTIGRVTLDGTDLREFEIEGYRRLLGIVEQDVFLFDGTVQANIAYGRRHATREQVVAAARAANADGFIRELERGYETLIGERGVRLSGGQKQRLAIARALLADPRILILDEATSNLDTESERLIQESLATLMKGRTCFVIAHRLSTIRHADLIVMLDKIDGTGRIVERGAHDELMAKGGNYARVLKMQLGERE